MDGELDISLDKLPIKRLDAIEESGSERFPTDVGYDEKRVNLVRRIDFAWAVEREDPSKKRKIEGASAKESVGASSSQQQWQWQSLVENLQLAHQELSVIIDLINTVEANDAVTVAGMTRPMKLPYEHLSDLAVSTATKLQGFRNLGKYFKQSAKALEEQIAREARFYGALIRLQQNWKIKRHRLVAAASGNEGFYIDLFDNSLYDLVRPSSMSTIPVEHDAAGMLTVKLPRKSCHSLQFEFFGLSSAYKVFGKTRTEALSGDSPRIPAKEQGTDEERVRDMHLTLRDVHRAIHDEQVFDLVNREACNPSLRANLTGIKENYLRLSIGEGASVSLSLVSPGQDDKKVGASESNTVDLETSNVAAGSFDGATFAKEIDITEKSGVPRQIGFEIYLRQLFHEYVFARAKSKAMPTRRSQIPGQPAKDNSNILGHFCMSLAHRIFSNKVLAMLENLVHRTPYVQLISHPTWHSRTSSWTLSMKIPESIIHAASQIPTTGVGNVKVLRSQFWTKVVVIDDSISVQGEGAPNVLSLFKGKSEAVSSINGYDCDLADLPIILLQQVASQIIQWLHEEALTVGIKANRDFLSLAFELEQGEIARLVAHVDPEDTQGCISWWLTVDDGLTEEHKFRSDTSYFESQSRKFLGYLPLDLLHSTLLDFLNLCSY